MNLKIFSLLVMLSVPLAGLLPPGLKYTSFANEKRNDPAATAQEVEKEDMRQGHLLEIKDRQRARKWDLIAGLMGVVAAGISCSYEHDTLALVFGGTAGVNLTNALRAHRDIKKHEKELS